MWYPKFELYLIWVWKTETFKPSFVFLAFKIVEIRGDRDATIDDPVQEYIYFVVSVTRASGRYIHLHKASILFFKDFQWSKGIQISRHTSIWIKQLDKAFIELGIRRNWLANELKHGQWSAGAHTMLRFMLYQVKSSQCVCVCLPVHVWACDINTTFRCLMMTLMPGTDCLGAVGGSWKKSEKKSTRERTDDDYDVGRG